MFFHAAGVKIQHVPYKGSAPAMTDLIGGQIPFTVDTVSAALPHLKDGVIMMNSGHLPWEIDVEGLRTDESVASIDEPTGVVTRPIVTPMSSGGVISRLIPPRRVSDAAKTATPAATTSHRHRRAPPRERR